MQWVFFAEKFELRMEMETCDELLVNFRFDDEIALEHVGVRKISK